MSDVFFNDVLIPLEFSLINLFPTFSFDFSLVFNRTRERNEGLFIVYKNIIEAYIFVKHVLTFSRFFHFDLFCTTGRLVSFINGKD